MRSPVSSLLRASQGVPQASSRLLQLTRDLGCLLELRDNGAMLTCGLLLKIGEHLLDALHLCTNLLVLLLDDRRARVVLLFTEFHVRLELLGPLAKTSVELLGACPQSSVELRICHLGGAYDGSIHRGFAITSEGFGRCTALGERGSHRCGDGLIVGHGALCRR